MLYSHFCAHGKTKIKHPSDIPTPNSGGSDLRSNVLPTRPRRRSNKPPTASAKLCCTSGDAHSQKWTYNCSFVPATLTSCTLQITLQDPVSHIQGNECNTTTISKWSDSVRLPVIKYRWCPQSGQEFSSCIRRRDDHHYQIQATYRQ